MSDKTDAPELKTDENGREYYEYPSGLTKWKDTGHFRTAPLVTPISDDPRGMLQRRNDKSRQIAREAIDEGAGLDPSKWGTGEGWRSVIVHTVQTYLNSKNLRGMAETFTKLATAGGYLSPEVEKGRVVHIENLNVGVAELVARILAAKRLPATEENVTDAAFVILETVEDEHSRNRAERAA